MIGFNFPVPKVIRSHFFREKDRRKLYGPFFGGTSFQITWNGKGGLFKKKGGGNKRGGWNLEKFSEFK